MIRFGSSRREQRSILPVRAVTRKDGKIHVVLGKATPPSGDRGSVTFSIITENGKMVFNTSYHFETKPKHQNN
jgi:hypothetical protein